MHLLPVHVTAQFHSSLFYFSSFFLDYSFRIDLRKNSYL